ncbi:galactokinase [Singulisphaera sp. GP187]|uniref:galactokinase n=1 Tax=Singulisphaera sp. GP187 TaxID=1882752 RepID=UPI00092C9419|nr:galactokinase [Singulisphaera sp. GP187]SIO43035.1 galactokinase [Singulisphaera sp. GP187]
MPSPLLEAARAAYTQAFGLEPTILAQAPGRVELLGNHTDYNGGLVLATAIDRGTVIAGRPTPEREGQVHSTGFADPDRFDLEALEPGEPGTWGRYVRGVVWALRETHGPLQGGFQAAIAGDVPLGAGLSSSASLQAALALFLLKAGVAGQATDLDDPARMALAKLLRRGENEFVGVQSGLLDQFSVLFGRADMALSLDCRSLEYERLSLGTPPPAIVICDSKTSRRLADGMYNQRRAECERVVSFFQAKRGTEAVTWLRDLTVDELEEAWSQLDTIGRIRARHVLTENERVQQGAEALRAGDSARLGELMSDSHSSSRDDFGNSSSYLEALIESAEEAPGYLGGKLSGAGWAGCTVNLVDAAQADDFAEAVRHHYTKRTAIVPDVHICHAAAGASEL